MVARRISGILLFMLALTGCEPPRATHVGVEQPTGTQAAANPSASETPKTAGESENVIGVSLLALDNPFFVIIGDTIKAEGAKNGYQTIVLDANKKVEDQQKQIKEFIVKKVAAIVLSPADTKAIVPAIAEANAAGIPVFTVDIPCNEPGAKFVSQICTDNFDGGRQAATAMIEALPSGGQVAILHAKVFESCRLRVKGFKEVVEKHNATPGKAKLEIVGEYECDGAKEAGYKAGLDALQSNPDVAGIFAINDPAALGAYKALEQSGKAKSVVLIGFDGMPEGKRAIKEGKIYADPIQFPDKMGVMVVQSIVDYYAGKKPKPEVLIPTALYRKADAEADKTLK